MTGITLGGSPRSLLTHMALYGLAAICEDAGHPGLCLSWTPGMSPQGRLDINLDADGVAQIVRDHASRCATPASWPQQRIGINGSDTGLMSPRIGALVRKDGSKQIPDRDAWRRLQRARHQVFDDLIGARKELDLRFLAALGEPCHWRLGEDTGNPGRYQDAAASRLEMQPRNRGSEFVGNRLSKVAVTVAARTTSAVREGLQGRRTIDEAGRDQADSRSATGLTEPGPVDNAIVWCALWGLSQTSLALKTSARAQTSVATRGEDREYFYTPIWRHPLHPARLRTLLAARALRIAAEAALHDSQDRDKQDQDKQDRDSQHAAETVAARQWLRDRHITAVLTFPVNIYGSASAPERRAGQGTLYPLSR